MVLAGTYRITRLLGKGGMGSVWEGRHVRLEATRVAIKVLHAEVAEDPESVARFQREAQIASRLGHPNIVQVLDINQLENGTQYLVLEYLEGQNLAERLFKRGPVPLEPTLALIRQVGSALYVAHKEGIIHRDLKPHNIFLCPTETNGYVTEVTKVLDFGISKIRGSQTVKTQTAIMLGTPQYMSPEQAMGAHDLTDGRTDIFALGTIVYEMLSGQPAFQGQSIPEVVFNVVYNAPRSLAELVPALPPHIVAAVERAMRKQRDERFADISDFVEALTGNRLATLRSDGVAPRIQSAPEAFAATMAPSTGQKSLGETAMAATMAPASQPGIVITSAETLNAPAKSGAAPVAAAALGTAQSPASATNTGRAHGEQAIDTMLARERKKPIGVMLGIAITLMAGAAALFFMLRSPSQTGELAGGTPTNERTDMSPVAKTTQLPDSPEVAQVGTTATQTRNPGELPGPDNGSETGPNPGTATLKANPNDAIKPMPENGASQTEQGMADNSTKPNKSESDSPPRARATIAAPKEQALTPEQEEMLKRAQELLAQNRAGAAITEVNKLLFQKVKSQEAYFLHVKANCANSDLAGAQTHFSRLQKAWRQKAMNYCKGYEIELGN